MRLSRLAVVLVPAIAILAAAAAPSVRKDAHGVYGMIDSVVFEHAAGSPDRVQLWGEFALANVVGVKNGEIDYIQIGFFHPPKRGYMYYTLNRRDEAGSRVEWAALKAVAGTGKLAAWGAHMPAPDSAAPKTTMLDTARARIINTYNGRVRAIGEPVAAPDTFPERMRSTSPTPRRVMLKSAAELGFVRPDPTR